MKKTMTTMTGVAALATAFAACSAFAQSASAGRDAFLKQQAIAEMQRVSAQVDVIASNQEELSSRVKKAEALKGEIDGLRGEIAALKGAIAELRREMQGQRTEIVQDLSKKIASMRPATEKPATPQKQAQTYAGPCYEYTVQSGDTLSLIAKAFGSTVQRIKEVNGMKNDMLKVGQKINVPKE